MSEKGGATATLRQQKISKMKTTILLAMVIAGMTYSCSHIKEKSAMELLENSKMREEVYSAILNDHAYSTDLLNIFLKAS